MKYSILCITPLIFNYYIKTIVFSGNFFEGTGGTDILSSLNFIQIISFFIKGLLAILGINIGPEYLNGYNFIHYSTLHKIIYIIFFITELLIFFVYLYQYILQKNIGKKERILNLKVLLLTVFSIGLTLVSGCITIRLELRWLTAPYVIFLIYLSHILEKVKSGYKIPSKIWMAFSVFLITAGSVLYMKNCDKIYMIKAFDIATETYEATIKEYGEKLNEYHIVLKGNNELQWAVDGNGNGHSIFDIYMENTPQYSIVTQWDEISPVEKEIKCFEMQDDLSVLEVEPIFLYETVQFLDMVNANHSVMPDTKADTPSGKGLCSLSQESFTIISGYTDIIEEFSYSKNDVLYFEAEMPYESSDGANLSVFVQTDTKHEIINIPLKPTYDRKSYKISLEKFDGQTGNILFVVTSPSGDAASDWVTIYNARIIKNNDGV